MEEMKLILDYDLIYTLMGEHLINFIACGLVGGLFLDTAMEFIGYGVFKALSLLNIRT